MDASDVRVHHHHHHHHHQQQQQQQQQQQRTNTMIGLEHRGMEFVPGSGSRAIRERLSAAVTTRQLKRAAASTVIGTSSELIANATSFNSGLLSIRATDVMATENAIQEQPLDFSKNKRKVSPPPSPLPLPPPSLLKDNDNLDINNTIEITKPWKKSRKYSQSTKSLDPDFQEFNQRRSNYSDEREPSSGIYSSGTSVQSSSTVQKMATIRPFKNQGSLQSENYFVGQLPLKMPFVSLHSRINGDTQMSPTLMVDNINDFSTKSTESYLEFRRQILSLHQSLGVKARDTDYDHHHHNHNHHHHRNGHHFESIDRDSSGINQLNQSSNSSCSSLSPVADVRRTSPSDDNVINRNLSTSGVNMIDSSLNGGPIGHMMGNDKHSTSSTSSVEGVDGISTKRRSGRSLPEELKDEAYWERRRKNNEAAKRSRDARRAKEDEIAIRAAFLEQENIKLRVEVQSLKSETTKLRCLLYNS